MSWFDSKSLQKYAKSTLLQAQKQIDKVLDINEEEIVNKPTSNTKLESTSTVNPKTDSFFNNLFPDDQSTKEPVQRIQIPGEVNFESFLNQDTTSKPHKKSDQDGDDFFNQLLPKVSTEVATFSPTTSMSSEHQSSSHTVNFTENSELEVDLGGLLVDEKAVVKNVGKKGKKSKNKNSSQSITPTNSLKSMNRSPRQPNPQLEIEKIEKQNRVI